MIRTDARVTAFSDEGVELSNSETLPTHTLVWTAGVKPPEVLQTLPVKKEKGRIVVNEMLEVPGCPGVWALGDCASIPNASTGRPQAHRLAAAKGLELQDQVDYSLAEIYRQPVIGGLSTPKKALGFVA
jgi:NADH dehydrogenase